MLPRGGKFKKKIVVVEVWRKLSTSFYLSFKYKFQCFYSHTVSASTFSVFIRFQEYGSFCTGFTSN